MNDYRISVEERADAIAKHEYQMGLIENEKRFLNRAIVGLSIAGVVATTFFVIEVVGFFG